MSRDLPPDLAAEFQAIFRAVPEAEAAGMCRLTVAELKRMRRAGTGPAHTTLSRGRIGYRIGVLLAWLYVRKG